MEILASTKHTTICTVFIWKNQLIANIFKFFTLDVKKLHWSVAFVQTVYVQNS